MTEQNQSLSGIDLVRQMLRSTYEAKIKWKKVAPDRFEATARDQQLSVEFIYLMRVEEMGCDRTIARLSAFHLIYDYSIGTDGFDLICEMLAVDDEEWVEARARGQEKLKGAIDFLRHM